MRGTQRCRRHSIQAAAAVETGVPEPAALTFAMALSSGLRHLSGVLEVGAVVFKRRNKCVVVALNVQGRPGPRPPRWRACPRLQLPGRLQAGWAAAAAVVRRTGLWPRRLPRGWRSGRPVPWRRRARWRPWTAAWRPQRPAGAAAAGPARRGVTADEQSTAGCCAKPSAGCRSCRVSACTEQARVHLSRNRHMKWTLWICIRGSSELTLSLGSCELKI